MFDQTPQGAGSRGEFAAYFMIVHAERSPMIFLVGIPVSVGLYAALFLSYLI